MSYGGSIEGGGFSYGPPPRIPRKRRRNSQMSYTVNLLRSFFGFNCFLYSTLIIILYSTAYIFLPVGNYKSELRTVLMLWNSFKPLGMLVVAYCCTQKTMPLWKCFIYGSFVGCVFLGTFFYLLIMSYDYASCNSASSDPDNSCNDPLFCCVHYLTEPHCHGEGPCTIWTNGTNATGAVQNITSPYNNTVINNTSSPPPVQIIITQEDLKSNPNFVLAYWLFVLAFILEAILLYMFFIVLNSINSGLGLFMDTSVQYSYPVYAGRYSPRSTPDPYDRGITGVPTSYQDEIISGHHQKQHGLQTQTPQEKTETIKKNQQQQKKPRIVKVFVKKFKRWLVLMKSLLRSSRDRVKEKTTKLSNYMWRTIKEVFVLRSDSQQQQHVNERRYTAHQQEHQEKKQFTQPLYYNYTYEEDSSDNSDFTSFRNTHIPVDYFQEQTPSPPSPSPLSQRQSLNNTVTTRRNPTPSLPPNTTTSFLPFSSLTDKKLDESFSNKFFM